MSLINDALKKAQHLQAAAPAPAATPAAAPKLKTRPAQVVPPPIVSAPAGYVPMSPRTRGSSKLVLAVSGGVFLAAIGTLGLAAYLVFGRSAQAGVAPAETPAEEVAEPVAPAPPPVQVAATPPPPEAVTPPAPPPPPPKRINRPNAVIQDFVNRMQVSGIRAGARPKALINDRVYAVGELVSAELDLRLTTISSHALGFEDAGGNTYDLQF